jgi:hypothetical protein
MKITVNNTECVVTESISITLNSPLFNDEISYSLDFSMPYCEVNNRAFGYINRIDVSDNKTREFDCSIEFGVLIFRGTLSVQPTSDSYTVYFKGAGDFWTEVNDTDLKDLDLSEALTFADNTEAKAYIDRCIANPGEYPYAFPMLIARDAFTDFPVEFNTDYYINKHWNQIGYFIVNTLSDILDGTVEGSKDYATALKEYLASDSGHEISASNPSIPFVYLHYLYQKIFLVQGFSIRSSVFDSKTFLQNILLGSNYMLNEYSLDSSAGSETQFIIQKISSGSDPTVTTLTAHGLKNCQFIKIKGSSIASLNNKIFQAIIEDEDETTEFKLKGADTSDVDEYESLYFTLADEDFTIAPYSNGKGLTITFSEDASENFSISRYYCFHLISDDFTRTIFAFSSGDVTTFYWDDPSAGSDNLSSLTFANATLQNIFFKVEGAWVKTIPVSKVSSHDITYETETNAIVYLAKELTTSIKECNIQNHLPDVTVNEFFDAIRHYLGIIPFVSPSSKNVDIKLIDDILNDEGFKDITDYTLPVKEIENPGYDGYLLQSSADSGDSNLEEMLPVTTIDTDKYTIKESVEKFADLPTGDSTNDVRLVTGENIYYVYNRSILNSEDGWEFLCYNLLDKEKEGDEQFEETTDASTLLPDKELLKAWVEASDNGDTYQPPVFHSLGNTCKGKNFPEIESDIAVRLVYYHGKQYGLPYAAHDIYNMYNKEIDGAEFAFRWEGVNGIINRLRNREIYWQVNRRKDFTTTVYWPVRYLVDFKFWKKYRVSGIDCLVSYIELTLNPDGTISFSDTGLVRV